MGRIEMGRKIRGRFGGKFVGEGIYYLEWSSNRRLFCRVARGGVVGEWGCVPREGNGGEPVGPRGFRAPRGATCTVFVWGTVPESDSSGSQC